MTANQIAYQNMVETRRANMTREEETERHNRRTEDLTDLHNQSQRKLWGAQTDESEARTYGTWIDNFFMPIEKLAGVMNTNSRTATNLLGGFGNFSSFGSPKAKTKATKKK